VCVTLAAGLVLRLPHIQCKTASASDIVDTDRAFLEVEMLAAMAGIAREIESYNSAYQLAWEHISEHQRRERQDIARRLHESIRRQVNEGATEAVSLLPRRSGILRKARRCREQARYIGPSN
jgi:hypothetical protein